MDTTRRRCPLAEETFAPCAWMEAMVTTPRRRHRHVAPATPTLLLPPAVSMVPAVTPPVPRPQMHMAALRGDVANMDRCVDATLIIEQADVSAAIGFLRSSALHRCEGQCPILWRPWFPAVMLRPPCMEMWSPRESACHRDALLVCSTRSASVFSIRIRKSSSTRPCWARATCPSCHRRRYRPPAGDDQIIRVQQQVPTRPLARSRSVLPR